MQIAAHDLGVPLDQVYIAETATDKVRQPPAQLLCLAAFRMSWLVLCTWPDW